MSAGPFDTELREAARHRGFRLVRSRVKTPGKGDYGKYGLVDAKGAAVFGRDQDGPLTANAAEVAAFLREGSASTWAASVETAPEAPAPKTRVTPKTEEEVPLAIRPRSRARRVEEEDNPAARPTRRRSVEEKEKSAERVTAKPISRPEPAPSSPPEPKLWIRRATAADAEAVADLVALIPGDGDRARIAEMCGKRGADVFVADQWLIGLGLGNAARRSAFAADDRRQSPARGAAREGDAPSAAAVSDKGIRTPDPRDGDPG